MSFLAALASYMFIGFLAALFSGMEPRQFFFFLFLWFYLAIFAAAVYVWATGAKERFSRWLHQPE